MTEFIKNSDIGHLRELCDSMVSVLGSKLNYSKMIQKTQDMVASVQKWDIGSDGGIFDKGSSVVMSRIEKIAQYFNVEGDTLTGQDIKAIYNAVGALSKDILQLVEDVMKGKYGALIDDISDVFKDFMVLAKAMVSAAIKLAIEIDRKLEPIIDQIQVKLSEAEDKFDAFKEKIGTKLDTLSDKVSSKLDKISKKAGDEFQEWKKTQSQNVKDEFSAMKKDLKDLSSKVHQKFDGLGEDMKKYVAKAENFFDKLTHKDTNTAAEVKVPASVTAPADTETALVSAIPITHIAE